MPRTPASSATSFGELDLLDPRLPVPRSGEKLDGRWRGWTRRTLTLMVVAAVLTACAGDRGEHAPCADERWLGAWTAAPSDTTEALVGDQSLRLLLTPLRSGEMARVRLSNRFGEEPLVVSSAFLGVQDQGPSLRPGTPRRLHFDGRSDVVLPAGGERWSDPVALSIEAMEPVAVSVFVAEPGYLTRHSQGMQTSYLADPSAGDVTGDEVGDAYTTTTTERPLVTGLDVRGPGGDSVIAMVGDSLTDGDQSLSGGFDTDTRLPDALARRLLDAGASLSPINLGIGGNRVVSEPLIPRFGPSILDRLDDDLLSREDVTDVVLFAGINDLGIPPGSTAEEVIDGLGEVVRRSRAMPGPPRVVVATLTPAGGATGLLAGHAAAEPERQAVNAAIREGALGDAFVDFDAAVRDPVDPSRIDPAFDGGDGLHFRAEGYARLAEVFDLSRFAGRRCAVQGQSGF